MQSHARQNQVSASWLLLERLRDRLWRPQLLRQRFSHIAQRIARTTRNHKLAFAKKRARFMPLRDVAEGIDSNQEEESIRLTQRTLQPANCIDRVVRRDAGKLRRVCQSLAFTPFARG